MRASIRLSERCGDSPIDDPSFLCREFLKIKLHLVCNFAWVSSNILKRLPWFLPSVMWTSIQVGVEDLSWPGGVLDSGPSRCDPKRARREVAGEFSEPDSEGAVFEAAWSSFEPHGGIPCPFGQRFRGIG